VFASVLCLAWLGLVLVIFTRVGTTGIKRT